MHKGAPANMKMTIANARAAVVEAAKKVNSEQELYHLDASVYEGAEGVAQDLKWFNVFPLGNEKNPVIGVVVCASYYEEEDGQWYPATVDEIEIPELRNLSS